MELPLRAAAPRRLLTALLGLLGLAFAASACGEGGPAGHGPDVYEGTGVVEAVLAEDAQLVVAHDPIEGLMPAMTMSFDVADPDVLRDLAPGQRIAFHLEAKEGTYRILEVRTIEGEGAAGRSGVAIDPADEAQPAAPFRLTDQDGETLALEDLRGKTVLLDFIYTHCPGPCPILTSTHVRVQRTLDPELRDAVHFVSISIDPARDTPEALRDYAEAHGADLAQWSFLTGEEGAVDAVLRSYGVGATPAENGEIVHVVATYLIDPEGRIARRYVGLEHHADELRADVERVVAEAAGRDAG